MNDWRILHSVSFVQRNSGFKMVYYEPNSIQINGYRVYQFGSISTFREHFPGHWFRSCGTLWLSKLRNLIFLRDSSQCRNKSVHFDLISVVVSIIIKINFDSISAKKPQ